ncbi:helix-turn-helix transcriptional regulator [Carnobacterium maltaromaticum]|uniref:helix-turn-helix domain-containing protein n=1 Tax=Carnobacterium maltaromaticum TaxID=2751 RepID=UPI00295F2330|nr:helix-turn-helix transcriptional regulator [Carnobacterium maltaromaticum]
MSFGQKLNYLREKQGLTQNELARILFIQQTTVSSYEKDKISPSAETIVKAADYFNVTADYLLEIKSNKTPSKIEEVFQDLLIELENEHEFDFINTNSLSDKTAELIKKMIRNDLGIIEDILKK